MQCEKRENISAIKKNKKNIFLKFDEKIKLINKLKI